MVQDIAVLEKRADGYKKFFVKKDLASVMDIVSGIAKDASVKILSVKPHAEEALDNYVKSSFLITLTAPTYHALGDFISRIENHKDIYLVNEINVNSASASSDAAAANMELAVSLKINAISYL